METIMSMNNTISMNHKSAHLGFSLIEVLVALLILSVGMLGAAGMQTQSMQSGGLAAQRLSVIMKAQEIAERIRVNSAFVGSYNVATGDSGTNNNCGNGVATCTPAQLAEYDVYLWKQDLLSILPDDASTTASIVVLNPTTLATVTITISWQSSAGAQTYTSILQVDATETVLGG